MARFNIKNENQVVNYEGAKAYRFSPEMDLYTRACSMTFQPKFYVFYVEDQLEGLRRVIKEVTPDFVLKLAVYLRENMGLRSVPLVLLIELSRTGYTGSNLRRAVCRVIQRADEITEILSYYSLANQRSSSKKLCKLASAIKKGVADAFHKFDEYQFAKYDRGNYAVRLKDAMFLTHPKPLTDAEADLFEKIANDGLETPYTWEVELSEIGKAEYPSDEEKNRAMKEKWEELIFSGRLGYMAMLRNLRNFVKYGISKEAVDRVIETLIDRGRIQKSKQLPFRFLSAYKTVYNYLKEKEVPLYYPILDAVESAMRKSLQNISLMGEGDVCVAADVSGSMYGELSLNSNIRYYEVGLLLGALTAEILGGTLLAFDDNLYNETLQVHSHKHICEYVMRYERGGGGTYGHLIPQCLLRNKVVVDKVFIFTDMQMWGGDFEADWKRYKRFNPKVKLYIFDIEGYGHAPISPEYRDVWYIGGWSNEIFDIVSSIENGSSTIEEIMQVEL